MHFNRIPLDEKLNGKGIGAIKVIVQDESGFIWLGAEYGLARYDGNDITRYSAEENGGNNTLLSNYINDIVFDNNGEMWIATDRGLNLYNRETDDFSVFKPDQNRAGNNRVAAMAVDKDDNLILARDDGVTVVDKSRTIVRHFTLPQHDPQNFVSVHEIFVDSTNTVWLGTKGAGAAQLNVQKGQFRFFKHVPNDPRTIVSDFIYCINEDHTGNIWFGSYSGGASLLKKGSVTFKNFRDDISNPNALGKLTVWDIFTDQKGVTWLATDPGGLARYDEAIDGFIFTKHSPYDVHSLTTNQVRRIFEDRNGDLWIGLFPSGVNFFNRQFGQFENYQHKPDDPNSISDSAILSIYQDRDNDIWVGTENGLNLFDPKTQKFTRYQHDPKDPSSLRANAILSLNQDLDGSLWVGTWSGGVHRLEKSTGTIIPYQNDPKAPYSLSNDFVWAMTRDHSGRMWLGTEGGGLELYRPKTNDFQHFRFDPLNSNSIDSDYVWTMVTDNNGDIWIGTTEGLNHFNPNTFQFTQFDAKVRPKNPFAINRVRALLEDSLQRIWIGTQDSGLYLYDTINDRFFPFPHNEQLPANYVTGFVEDPQGFVWASTTNGLIRISMEDFSFSLFDRSEGLIGKNFNREANLIDNQGKIYFGAVEGLSIFNPQDIKPSSNKYNVTFTKLKVFNREVEIGKEGSPLKKALWLTKELNLTHDHAMFSIDFSAIEFRFGNQKRYSYKLEGFNSDWIDLGQDHSVTFTNLNPGSYILRVKAQINGEDNLNQAKLNINIAPPPWLSAWAFALYGISGILLVLMLKNTIVKNMQLRNERSLNQELKKLNEIKDAFLANTSHELRTPLNGIIGIADSLEDYFKSNDNYAAHHLHLIASSGRRLANLINDILDYSKLANHNLQLQIKAVDIKQTTETVFTLLAPLTVNKSLELIHDFDERTPFIYADENRLQQILINLVGNGIKYCSKGFVRVGMNRADDMAEIYVEDTGIGIESSQKEQIFEAFNQLQSSNSREYGGTGLGLAITRQLIEQHQGKIWLDESYREGARFVFTLPLKPFGQVADPPIAESARHESSAEKALTKPLDPQKGHSDAAPVVSNKPRNTTDHTILVVDDDAVNRLVLAETLKIHDYHILEAENGPDAIAILEQNPQINLIIMDIMMPKMTGFEACAEIRKQRPMHDLPIVFLTAKRNAEEDLDECFKSGGNDYLTKPISKHELLPRIANHLRIQGIIRKLQLNLQAQGRSPEV